MKTSLTTIFCLLAGVLSVNLFLTPDAAAHAGYGHCHGEGEVWNPIVEECANECYVSGYANSIGEWVPVEVRCPFGASPDAENFVPTRSNKRAGDVCEDGYKTKVGYDGHGGYVSACVVDESRYKCGDGYKLHKTEMRCVVDSCYPRTGGHCNITSKEECEALENDIWDGHVHIWANRGTFSKPRYQCDHVITGGTLCEPYKGDWTRLLCLYRATAGGGEEPSPGGQFYVCDYEKYPIDCRLSEYKTETFDFAKEGCLRNGVWVSRRDGSSEFVRITITIATNVTSWIEYGKLCRQAHVDILDNLCQSNEIRRYRGLDKTEPAFCVPIDHDDVSSQKECYDLEHAHSSYSHPVYHRWDDGKCWHSKTQRAPLELAEFGGQCYVKGNGNGFICPAGVVLPVDETIELRYEDASLQMYLCRDGYIPDVSPWELSEGRCIPAAGSSELAESPAPAVSVSVALLEHVSAQPEEPSAPAGPECTEHPQNCATTEEKCAALVSDNPQEYHYDWILLCVRVEGPAPAEPECLHTGNPRYCADTREKCEALVSESPQEYHYQWNQSPISKTWFCDRVTAPPVSADLTAVSVSVVQPEAAESPALSVSAVSVSVSAAPDCPEGQQEFGGACAVPVACRPDQSHQPDNTCACPEGQREFDGRCAAPVACAGGEVSSGNVCVCTEGQREFSGVCVVPVACAGGELLSYANVCVCPTGQQNINGQCMEAAPAPVSVAVSSVSVAPPRGEGAGALNAGVTATSPPVSVSGGNPLVRTPDAVLSVAAPVGNVVSDLGIQSGGYAPVFLRSAVPQAVPADSDRLPEYAAPAALLGALAFSQFYPDYVINHSFDFSGENENANWEAGMHGHFHYGSFRSYVSVIQDNDELVFESGTTYHSNSFFASYRTIEAKDYMNYEVQLFAPWRYSKWEIKPNLSSEFHYDRDENHPSSETGAGLDLEYRF